MKLRILVVEDNTLNLELVTDLLEANGFEVLPAQTDEEGIALACRCAPDLILMDVSLPGLDGLAATKALRADPETRQVERLRRTNPEPPLLKRLRALKAQRQRQD